VDPKSVDLNYVGVWMQIYKLPLGYRKKTLITNLIEKKVGTFFEVDETETDLVTNDVYEHFYSCRQCWASKCRGL
jgi:hypothetical protein